MRMQLHEHLDADSGNGAKPVVVAAICGHWHQLSQQK